jgi:hypothetical protein
MAVVSIIPERFDIALYAGDGAELRVEAADAGTGDPIDLDGDILAQVKNQHADTTAVAEFAVDVTDAGDGVLGLALTGAQTAALPTGNMKFRGVWDVQWVAAGRQPRTLAAGNITCSPDVTRSP